MTAIVKHKTMGHCTKNLGRDHKGTLPSLTSLRFFAALLVVIHHEADLVPNLGLMSFLGEIGWLGVSFFFILSGFVLAWSFDSTVGPARYILRRLTRIYPLHLACLITSLTFFMMTGIVLGGYQGTPFGTIANFLLVQDWIPNRPNIRQAWNGVSWTLSCEFFFYLIAPFALPFLVNIKRLGYLWLAILVWLIFLAVVGAAWVDGWNRVLDFYFYCPVTRASEFFLGALGAQWIKNGFRVKSKILGFGVAFLPVSIYCVLIPGSAHCGALMNLFFVPGAILIILAFAGGDLNSGRTWTQNGFLMRLGEASFALYMIHALLLGALGQILSYFQIDFSSKMPAEIFVTTAFIAVSIALSLAVQRWFEAPVRKVLLRWLGTATARDPASRSL